MRVAAANGGLDLEMPSGKFMNRDDFCCRRSAPGKSAKPRSTTRCAAFFGLPFDLAGWIATRPTSSIPALNPEGREVALEAARSGMVLLKNEGNMLPLDKGKIKSIAVIGPDAYPAQPVGGGSGAVQPFAAVSFLQGIANYLRQRAPRFTTQPACRRWRRLPARPISPPRPMAVKPGLKAEFFDNANLSGITRRSSV